MARIFPDATTLTLVRLCAQYLRVPTSHATDGETGEPLLDFDPPLSPDEQATLADLTTMARFGVTLTLAEWQSIKADTVGLRQYLGVPSPSPAQTAAATKAIIRVLETIIREEP